MSVSWGGIDLFPPSRSSRMCRLMIRIHSSSWYPVDSLRRTTANNELPCNSKHWRSKSTFSLESGSYQSAFIQNGCSLSCEETPWLRLSRNLIKTKWFFNGDIWLQRGRADIPLASFFWWWAEILWNYTAYSYTCISSIRGKYRRYRNHYSPIHYFLYNVSKWDLLTF